MAHAQSNTPIHAPCFSQSESVARTMSSIELRDMINDARLLAGEPKVRNDHFLSRVEDELGDELEGVQKYFTPYHGNQVATYDLTLDQCMLVGMCESKAFQLLYEDAFWVSSRHYGSDDFPAIRKTYCIEVGRVKGAEKSHSGIFAQLPEGQICSVPGYDVLAVSRLDSGANQDQHSLGERGSMGANHHISAHWHPVCVSPDGDRCRLCFQGLLACSVLLYFFYCALY